MTDHPEIGEACDAKQCYLEHWWQTTGDKVTKNALHLKGEEAKERKKMAGLTFLSPHTPCSCFWSNVLINTLLYHVIQLKGLMHVYTAGVYGIMNVVCDRTFSHVIRHWSVTFFNRKIRPETNSNCYPFVCFDHRFIHTAMLTCLCIIFPPRSVDILINDKQFIPLSEAL